MTAAQRLQLVEVSLALALSEPEALELALRRAAAAVPGTAVEEALLQSCLFLGYPAALRGLAAWRQVSGSAAPTVRTSDEGEWAARGERTAARVYGEQLGRLRANVAALHPDLEQWMIGEGYGKVLGRPALDLVSRELCIIALLAPQDAGPQLYSHLRGALNAGAAEAEVQSVVALILPRLPAARATTLAAQWRAVTERQRSTTSGD